MGGRRSLVDVPGLGLHPGKVPGCPRELRKLGAALAQESTVLCVGVAG